MVKLSKYIKNILKEANEKLTLEIDFDIGVDSDMTVNDQSLNRIKFKVYYNG